MRKQIVIEIDEDRYSFINSIKDGVSDYQTSMMLYNAIRNGTVLPKHGRLIDAHELEEQIKTDIMGGMNYRWFIKHAPAILETWGNEE